MCFKFAAVCEIYHMHSQLDAGLESQAMTAHARPENYDACSDVCLRLTPSKSDLFTPTRNFSMKKYR